MSQMEDIITDLDKKLKRVQLKQGCDYLKDYNFYVKREEKKFRKLIEKLNVKNFNNTLKDENTSNLEKTILAIREDQIKQEKEKEQLQENEINCTVQERVRFFDWKTKVLGSD